MVLWEVGAGAVLLLIRIRHKIYKIPGLGALLSEFMRRLCVVRSEGVPPDSAQIELPEKKRIRITTQKTSRNRTGRHQDYAWAENLILFT